MHTNNGSIHHDIFKVGIFTEKLKDALEGPALNPAPEPLEYRIPVTETRRQIAPRGAGTSNPQYRFDKEARIPAGLARIALFSKTMARDGVPLRVRQNQSIQTHNSNLSEKPG